MITRRTAQKCRIIIFLALFLTTSLTPAFAGFLFFGSKKPPSNPQEQDALQKRINTYNEKALRLFENGRFEEAQRLWEKAIEMTERLQGVDESARGRRGPLEGDESITWEELDASGRGNAEELYDAAVELFNNEKYMLAKKMFDRIETIASGYKATRNYLTIIQYRMKQTGQESGSGSFQGRALTRREEREEWRLILKESKESLEARLRQQVDPLYEEALGLYKERQFKLAKDYFLEINEILPAYKDVERYLSRIDQDIEEEEERLLEEKRRQETLIRKKEKTEWQRMLEESREEFQKRLEQQAQPLYQKALDHYAAREFELAKTYFEEVAAIVDSYKSTQHYLDRINEDIINEKMLRQQERASQLRQKQREAELVREREEGQARQLREAEEKGRLEKFRAEMAAHRKEREQWRRSLQGAKEARERKLAGQAELVYREAVERYKGGEFTQAKQNFLEVEKIFPEYKSTKKYLARVDEDIAAQDQQLREIEEQRRQRVLKEKMLEREKQRLEWNRIIGENETTYRKKLEDEAGFIYNEAMRSYKAQRWEQARADFGEVQRILPGYKLTEKYLAQIDESIRTEARRERKAAQVLVERRQQESKQAQEQKEGYTEQLQKAAGQKDLARKQRQVEAIYRSAVSLYKNEDYAGAKGKFLSAANVLSGYKDIDDYLQKIDVDMAKAREHRRQERDAEFKRQMEEIQLAQKREWEQTERLRETEEQKHLEKLKKEASRRQAQREQWQNTLEDINQEHERYLKEQAESIYAEGLRYYDAGWFEQARDTFEEVNALMPGYKATAKYLKKIDARMRVDAGREQEHPAKIRASVDSKEAVQKAVDTRQEETARAARQTYTEALALYRDKKFSEAKLKFIEVESLSPGYKETLYYLSHIDEDIAMYRQVTQTKTVREAADDQVEKLFQQAMMLYKGKHYARAQEKFLAVEGLSPGYKTTKQYLERVVKEIEQEEKRRAQAKVAEEKAKKLAEVKAKKEAEALARKKTRDEEKAKRLAERQAKREEKRLAKKQAIEEKRELAAKKAEEKAKRMAQKREKEAAKRLAQQRAREEAKKQVAEKKAEEKIEKMAERKVGEEARQVAPPAEEKKEVSKTETSGRTDVVQQALVQQEQEGLPEESLEGRRKELQKARSEIQREYERQLRKLYDKAVKFYRAGDYREAHRLFLHIEETKPGYKRASSYLKKAEARMEKEFQRQDRTAALEPPAGPVANERHHIIEETLNAFEKSL